MATLRRAGLDRRVAKSRWDVPIAIFSIVSIVAHDLAHVRAGNWFNVFWICNLSALCVGPSILLRSRGLCLAGFTWLLPGNVVWLIDLFINHGNVLFTSYFIHLGGLFASAYGIRRFGTPSAGPLPAVFLLLFGILVSRWFLPEAPNVNAAHHIPKGWESLGSTFPRFAVTGSLLSLGLSSIFWLVALWIHRAFRPTPEASSHE